MKFMKTPSVRALLGLWIIGLAAVPGACAPASKPPAAKPASGYDYGNPVDVAAYGASPTAAPAQNVTAINAALAAKHFVRITRPGVYRINDHLTIFPHTRLTCGPGVTIQQTATVCILRNAHLLATPPDRDISIEGGTWDGNYTGSSPGDQVSPTDLTNPLRGVDGEIDAIGVNGFTVRDVLIQHCRAFGVQVSSSSDVTLTNIRLDIAKDGLHVNGPASRLHIAHVRGYTGDDFIALNAWDWVDSSPTAGDITDVDITDITQLAQSPTIPANTNQYGLIKFLAGTRHGRPANIQRVTVNGVRGVNSYRAFTFLIDADPREHVPSGPGIVSDVVINHVAVKTVNSPLFWLGQNIRDVTVSDLQVDPASKGPIVFVNGGTTTERLTIQGLTMRQAMDNPIDVQGTIGSLSLSNAHLLGLVSLFFTPRAGGKIEHLTLNGVTLDAVEAPK